LGLPRPSQPFSTPLHSIGTRQGKANAVPVGIAKREYSCDCAGYRAKSHSEQAVEIAQSFDNRDDLDLIGVGVMLIEDQIASMNERSGARPDLVAVRADTGKIP
jgi:hypothetical protein